MLETGYRMKTLYMPYRPEVRATLPLWFATRNTIQFFKFVLNTSNTMAASVILTV
jgi:hypothetical protein